MGYTIALETLDNSSYSEQDINTVFNKLKTSGSIPKGYSLVVQKNDTTLNLFIEVSGEQVFLFRYKPADNYGECIYPDDENFGLLQSLCDSLYFFIYGEEGEIYHVPTIGKPELLQSYYKIKDAYARSGVSMENFIKFTWSK